MSTVPPELTALASAAAGALTPEYGPIRVASAELLAGSSRSRVFRARLDGAGPASVIVKAPQTAEPWREHAALRVLGDTGVPGVTRLLAAREDPPLIVLADAGRGPSLADRLLGTDPGTADDALLSWATTMGTLQAATVELEAPFAHALADASPFGAPPLDTSGDLLAAAATDLATHLPALGVPPAPEALDALRGFAASLPTDARALDPGDACPDNNAETADGPVLFDFEFAEYRHVAWQAAYLRVPWPSCWCSWRLPAQAADRALARWRRVLAPALPSVATPAFDATLDLVTAAWVLLSVSWFLPAALAGDPATTDPGRPRPSRRQLVQYRLGLLARLPGVESWTALAAEAHAATVRAWGAQPLPLAPAYR